MSLHTLLALSFPESFSSAQHVQMLLVASAILLLLGGVFATTFGKRSVLHSTVASAKSYGKFFYVSFLKPHTGDELGGQQEALESFYSTQV